MDVKVTIADYNRNVNIQRDCYALYREAVAATLKWLTDAMADSHHSLGSLGIYANFSKLDEHGLFELQSTGKTVVGQVGVKLIEPVKKGGLATVYSQIEFWHQPHNLTPPTRVLAFCFDASGNTDVSLNDRPARCNSTLLIALVTEIFNRLRLDDITAQAH